MKMSQLKMAIREVVREEIRLGLKEIIGELKQPTKSTNGVSHKPPKKQDFSKNKVLNDVLEVEIYKSALGRECVGKHTHWDIAQIVYKMFKNQFVCIFQF